MQNEIGIIPEVEHNDILVIDEIPPFDCVEYDIFNEKDFNKYLDAVEKSIRGSMEYAEMVSYLRMFMDMNQCALFKNVSNAESTKIKIHLHHHPFTLWDIVITVFEKRSHYGESIEIELVAKEAMYLHYFLYIGLVPLAETTHELVHNQVLFIPLDIVLGNYDKFYNQYEQWMPDEIKEKYKTYQNLTKVFTSATNKRILEVVPTYLKIENGDIGTYKLPKLQEVLSILGNKLDLIEDRSPKGVLVDPYYMDPTNTSPLKDDNGLIAPFIFLN